MMKRTAGFQKHLEEKMEELGFKPLQYDLEMGSRPMMRMTERLGPSAMKDLADSLRPDFNAKVMGDTLFFRPVENLWGRTSSDRTAALSGIQVNMLFETAKRIEKMVEGARRILRDAPEADSAEVFGSFDTALRNLTLVADRLDAMTASARGGRTAADDAERLSEALDNVESALKEAISAAQDAERFARNMGGEVSRVVGGQLEMYLQRWLQAWIDNENQPGSVASLRKALEEWRDEQAEMAEEDARTGSARTASVRVGETVRLLKGGKTSTAFFEDGEEVKVVDVTRDAPYRIRLESLDGTKKLAVPMESAWKYLRGFSKPPSMSTMQKWSDDGVAKSVDGQRVEPDGHSTAGYPSWMLVLGMI